MKKIGILSFHRSHNCGSIMQAFAMQTVLTKLGFKAEFIDFTTKGQDEMYSVFTRQKNIKGLIKNILYMLNYITLNRHWHDYDEFIQNNLVLSEKCGEGDDLSQFDKRYDMYICGSDQIWNVTIQDYSDAYYLNFTNKTKMAYAPSFGARDPRTYYDNIENIKTWLNNISYLSIRENSGKDIIRELTTRDVPVVLDPTLLLNASDYARLEESSGIKGDYIFYYATLHSRDLDQFVRKLSMQTGLKVIVWNSREYILRFEWMNGFRMAKHQHPGVYLDLIKNAALVVTTSFHGAVFSTMYRKKFWVLKNGDMYKGDDRIMTMTKLLKISERVIPLEFDKGKDYWEEVDYLKFEEALEVECSKSFEFLKKCVVEKTID